MEDGVLPAIDKISEMELIDTGRVGVFGHSFGGYAVYALISLSDRFKCAIAQAGAADLISNYGVFIQPRWFEGSPGNLGFWSETGQAGLGAPPWISIERYVRNSPITYADRITTPLMIIQGDRDFVSIQQGEEMFSALERQGKSVVFVRYVGEGHSLQSPANIVDVWNRMFAWFDGCLKAPKMLSE